MKFTGSHPRINDSSVKGKYKSKKSRKVFVKRSKANRRKIYEETRDGILDTYFDY